MDITPTIMANSDQINADDLIAGQHITVTITGVRRGKTDQPVEIAVAETNRVWRPCKTVRRILVAAWGPQAQEWIGRQARLYRDPSVAWAGQAVGGIRVSALSHIDRPLTVALANKRGSRVTHTVEVIANK